MSMLGRWFSKEKGTSEAPAAEATAPRITSEGLVYSAPKGDTTAWLAMPYEHADHADLGARLQQIYLEGIGEKHAAEFLLPWDDLYRLLDHPEFSGYGDALGIPAYGDARPRLESRGALVDPDFTILLDDWVDAQGKPLQPAPRLQGRVLVTGTGQQLLPPALNGLLNELGTFHATAPAERSLTFKEQAFGRMRKLAKAAGCRVSDYVERTIVLTPERLQLRMDSRGAEEGRVVEVQPSFDDAPERWLEVFDRFSLQDSYDVPAGAGLVRVVLAPEVKSVLAEIKRMPGRRVAGARAQAFVRNPYAVLGEDAKRVIDAEQFDAALELAGIRFTRFTPHAKRGDKGQVERIRLTVEGLDAQDASESLWLETTQALDQFIERFATALEAGAQCFAWRRHDLEIVGESTDHLDLLRSWRREWTNPGLWTATELLDLSNYSERIEDIGEETPFVTPVIARGDAGNNWFEGNVTVGLQLNGGGIQGLVPFLFDEVPTLQEVVRHAELSGAEHVKLPGLQAPVPLKDAQRAVAALAKALVEIKQKTFEPDSIGLGKPKIRLVIKRNLDEVDYSEARAAALAMPDGVYSRVPSALRPEHELRPHQHFGLAWLQHLWSVSPQQCRGALLADDMGLGKTLQLLCFLVACFERDPGMPPALIVAPVALLENWQQELERFFQPDTLPLLVLYGDSLRALRATKADVDSELRQQGITRLLKKNWLGDAKLVLTTYETMRDLEFTLASQQWSVMICDEAQKIKTPGAMVTRSAKKQKVRFRIACTGTPVENSLADLWCLFDFVQPGMLGALSQFSNTYRQPIEAKTEEQKAKVEELRELIKPQILHRKKAEVARELPLPVEDEVCKNLPMSEYQHGLYETAMRVLNEQRLTNPSAQLRALQAVRQICSDPHGHAEPETRSIPIQRLTNESPKLGWLMHLLQSLAARPAENHKVIVFCEFRELQLMLQRVIAAFFGFAPSIVNGDTSADPKAADGRQKLINGFQQRPGFGVIILSPLAVGFGVNIQAANHVVHFTRTWNPAKEDQATARAYRIGQTRVVTVYYPGVVSNKLISFDVTLDKLLSKKRALAADMLNGCGDLKVADFAEVG